MKTNELENKTNSKVPLEGGFRGAGGFGIIDWLSINKISHKIIDKEIVEIEDFGKMFLAETDHIQSILRLEDNRIEFNLLETPEILIDEGVYYVAFPFGDRWYYYDLREEFCFNLLKYVGKRTVPGMNVPFVNLGVHSPFELLNGSGDLSLWVKKAKTLGQEALGICDHNTMAGTLALQKECAKAGIKHVFGYSFNLLHEGEKIRMKIYCQTQKGLRNLLRIQKEIMVDSPDNTIDLNTLLFHGEGNVLVFGKLSAEWLWNNMDAVYRTKLFFDQIFYQFDPTEYSAERIDKKVLEACKFFMEKFYKKADGEFLIEPVLICDNYYLDADDSKNKIILNKIATGASHEQSHEQYFKDTDELYAMFSSMFSANDWDIERLFRQMCKNTALIATNAEAKYELGKMYMPQYIMRDSEKSKYETRRNMFLELLEEGMQELIPEEVRKDYRKQLEEEVYIIESTNNLDYFLIQWDMIQEAKRRGIATGIGRGSAGGSLVSYLLGIISIDPIKYDLLFSRFLVPERCGLNWCENTTVIGEDIFIPAGEKVIEILAENKRYLFTKDSNVHISRNGEEMTVKAESLMENDEIIFDNRDRLWVLPEIEQ